MKVFHSLLLLLAVGVVQYEALPQGLGYAYTAYSNPYQNSFALATPSLRQTFTTKLAAQQQQQPQLVYNGIQQQDSATAAATYPQQTGNLFARSPVQFAYQTQDQLQSSQALQPQTYTQQDLLALQQQQLGLLYQQQQQLQQQDLSRISTNSESISKEKPQGSLLGVAYSPATQVSKVKYESGKLKYGF